MICLLLEDDVICYNHDLVRNILLHWFPNFSDHRPLKPLIICYALHSPATWYHIIGVFNMLRTSELGLYVRYKTKKNFSNLGLLHGLKLEMGASSYYLVACSPSVKELMLLIICPSSFVAANIARTVRNILATLYSFAFAVCTKPLFMSTCVPRDICQPGSGGIYFCCFLVMY